MATVTQLGSATAVSTVPASMKALVYHGLNDVRVETVPVPKIGADEILVKVHTCGICGTDLKKIATGSHSAPRIFGHETTGIVAAVGENVTKFSVGDRVAFFHHIPCGECYYCRHKVYAQCPVYKKVGCTAGYEPSGGGFAEYVRVMDWIVEKGVAKIPDGVSDEQASFMEPVNTCWKAIDVITPKAGETFLVIGQGPIGIILAVLAQRAGVRVITSDLFPQRLTIAKRFGLQEVIDASQINAVEHARQQTGGRGADAVILAVPGTKLIETAIQAARPGGRIMLFAQTVREQATIDPAAVCVDEKTLLGSYSASIDLQQTSTDWVFSQAVDLAGLVTHRFPLENAVEGLKIAAHPQPGTMKLVVQCAGEWKD